MCTSWGPKTKKSWKMAMDRQTTTTTSYKHIKNSSYLFQSCSKIFLIAFNKIEFFLSKGTLFTYI